MSVNGRHAVADRQRVRRPRERELDVLAREQFHRAATRRFGGQRVRGRVEGENGPVRRGILRLLLEHPERGAATGNEGRVDRRHRLAWSRGGGGRGAHGTHRERGAGVEIIGTVQVFLEPFLFTSGGPANSTLTVLLLVYQYAFGNSVGVGFGQAAALSLMVAVFLAVFSLVFMRLTRSWSTT
jgi:hypothetical protein